MSCSVLPLIGNMIEKLCTQILRSHLELYEILCDEQLGFRPNRSTGLASFTYIKNIKEEFNMKKIVGSIYLDLAKAFASINHELLLKKVK